MFTIQIGNEQQDLTYDNYLLALDEENQKDVHIEIINALKLFLNDTVNAFSQETIENRAIALAFSLYSIALKERQVNSEPLAIFLSAYSVRFAFEHLKI